MGLGVADLLAHPATVADNQLLALARSANLR
jgi:hypothetical protein